MNGPVIMDRRLLLKGSGALVVSFSLTIALGLAIVWLGLAVAYFSAYPVGFYITTFGFGGYVLAAAGRTAAGRVRTALA